MTRLSHSIIRVECSACLHSFNKLSKIGANPTSAKSMMNVFALCVFLLFGTDSISLVTSEPALLLTPYILKNETALARNLSRVDSKLFLNVTSYSGFLTVDEKYNSNLFFWYFPVENKTVTADTPWILWLQGGPGATSLAGLFVEIGPFMYDQHVGLKLREQSWNRKYPILFIDNPVGAGFSFTDSADGLVRTMDDCSSHLYTALQQFLELFPEHRRAPLYLAGESYAGHYVPALGSRILHPPPLKNLKLKDSEINLKGMMLGNPVIDRRDIVNKTSIYYQWGLIDSQDVEALRPFQERYSKAVKENKGREAFDYRDKLWDKLEGRTSRDQSYNVLKDTIPEIHQFKDFITRPDVKEAIHVGEIEFTFSNSTVSTALIKDFVVSLNNKVEELLEHFRLLIYCGHLDLVAPCVANADARRKNWRWSGRQAFLKAHRNPWWHDPGVAGYVKTGGNFSEVLVLGAGHIAPMDKPAEVFQLIDYFIRGLDLPLPTNYDESLNENPPYVDDDNKTTDTEVPNTKTSGTHNGLIASVVLNVIFAVMIIGGIIYGIRWKRRADTYFYSMVDDTSLDGALRI